MVVLAATNEDEETPSLAPQPFVLEKLLEGPTINGINRCGAALVRATRVVYVLTESNELAPPPTRRFARAATDPI